jgi:hypothetical protein
MTSTTVAYPRSSLYGMVFGRPPPRWMPGADRDLRTARAVRRRLPRIAAAAVLVPLAVEVAASPHTP